MREARTRLGLTRGRFLAIDTTAHARAGRINQHIFGSDFTVNHSALERPVDEVFDLIEEFSGLQAARLD